MKEDPIIVEQLIEASPAEIWNALTDPLKMRKWFFHQIADFNAAAGFETSFNVRSGDTDFVHEWKVIEVIPETMLKLNWRYKGYTGDSNVTFQLAFVKGRTALTVEHEMLEAFPQHIPEFKRESCLGGWNYFIRERLKQFVEQ